MKYEVVMFNMSNFSEWEKGVTNRNRQIFTQLTLNKKVSQIVAIDYLPFTLKRALKNYFSDIFKKNDQSKVVYKDKTSQCSIIQEDNPKIYHLSTIDLLFGSKKAQKKIEKILKIISDPSLTRIIWSYFPVDTFYFKIKNDLTVFDAVDNWIYHSSYKRWKRRLKRNYKKIANKADIIFTLNENLKNFFILLGRNENIYSISNGVDYSHFQKKDIFFDEKIGSIIRPIVGYVGIIDFFRLDFDFINYLIKNHPQKSFVFIGPVWPIYFQKIHPQAKKIRQIKKYPNVYFLGHISYDKMPYYIKQFDVAIAPYQFSLFTKYTSSLKILEYLASGLPVVSTPIAGADNLKNIIYLASDYPTFSENIDLALAENSSQRRRLRREAAKKEDWKYKVEEMMEIVDKKINEKNKNTENLK